MCTKQPPVVIVSFGWSPRKESWLLTRLRRSRLPSNSVVLRPDEVLRKGKDGLQACLLAFLDEEGTMGKWRQEWIQFEPWLFDTLGARFVLARVDQNDHHLDLFCNENPRRAVWHGSCLPPAESELRFDQLAPTILPTRSTEEIEKWKRASSAQSSIMSCA